MIKFFKKWVVKKSIRFLMGAFIFVGGEYLGYKVFTNFTQNTFVHLFGVLAFFMTLGGIILIFEIPFSYFDKLYREKIKTNKVIANIICIPMFILSILIFAIPAFVFYHFAGKYHQEQLEKFGVVQQVVIESESHGKNSNNYSNFRFYHNGKEWKSDLSIWNYKVGDTAKIIYSAENPNEVEWYEKYIQSKK